MLRRDSVIIWLVPSILLIVAYLLQDSLHINPDTIWLTHESNQLLAGGTYGIDFFDPNPPMILFLYIPAALLMKYGQINLGFAIHIYIFLMGLISLYLCSMFINKFHLFSSNLKRSLVLSVLVFVYFFIPIDELAQREHLLILLITPYLFLAMLDAEKKHPVPVWLRIMVGIIAAVGFVIKPYFLLTPLLLEFYLGIRLRRLRLEAILILLVLIFYLALIYLVTPAYYSVMLPFITNNYIGYDEKTFWDLVSFPFCFISLLSLILLFVIRNQDKAIFNISILALISCMGDYLLAKQEWYYHMIPMFSLAFMGLFFAAMHLLQEPWKINSIHSYLKRGIFVFAGMLLLGSIWLICLKTTIAIYTYKNAQWINVENAVRQDHPKLIYVFSLHPDLSAVMPYDVNVHNCSSVTGFWMLPALNKKMQNPLLPARKIQEVLYIQKLVTQDFSRCQPDLVIVDVIKNKPIFNGEFDYIRFFTRYPQFAAIWHKYHFQKKVYGLAFYTRR